MKLYGIKVKFYYEDVDGYDSTVFRKLYKHVPSDDEVKQAVAEWLISYKLAYDQKNVIFMVNEKYIEMKILDFYYE